MTEKLRTVASFAWALLNAFIGLTIVLNLAGVIVWLLAGCP